MTKEINNHLLGNILPTLSRETHDTVEQEAVPLSTPLPQSSSVHLTPDAHFLKKLASDLAKEPVVNQEKVAAAKQKIAEGTLDIFKPATQEAAFNRIAQNMLDLDQEL